MYKTYLLLALALTACDQGLQPLQERRTLCTSDSAVCWSQPVDDPRNTPWNDPRNCTQTKTDSTWTETCKWADTTRISITYSQHYKDLHPNYPHNGGGIVYIIADSDTISTKEW